MSEIYLFQLKKKKKKKKKKSGKIKLKKVKIKNSCQFSLNVRFYFIQKNYSIFFPAIQIIRNTREIAS